MSSAYSLSALDLTYHPVSLFLLKKNMCDSLALFHPNLQTLATKAIPQGILFYKHYEMVKLVVLAGVPSSGVSVK